MTEASPRDPLAFIGGALVMLIGAILTIVAPVLFLVGVMSIGGSTDVQLVAIIALIVGIWLIVLGRRAWRHERPDRSRTRI